MKTSPRVLIAGVGNIFFGDDAFGGEVARRLATRKLPAAARVVDFGIRILDLGHALLDEYDAVILVDATRRGGVPGTLYLIEPDPDSPCRDPEANGVEPHGMLLETVLRWAQSQGGRLPELCLVGCEPAVGEQHMEMGLSEPVEAAVDEAVRLVEQLVAEFLRHRKAWLSHARTRVDSGHDRRHIGEG